MNYRPYKLKLVLGILAAGLLLALLYHGWQGWGLGKGYPYNTFLYPTTSYTDFSDIVISAKLPNPYIDPVNVYLPFAFFAYRLPALLPGEIDLICFLFFSLAGLTLLLIKGLENIVKNPWLRVGVSLLLVALPYPIIFCVDRGNAEILMVLCVASSIYFYSQGRYLVGTLCLLPTLLCKIFYFVYLVLLARQRQWLLLFGVATVFIIVTLICTLIVAGPPDVAWNLYLRNSAYFTQGGVYENGYLEESAAPWNMYKIGLVEAIDQGLFAPIDFDWDGPFIKASYAAYAGCTMLFALFLAAYAWFVEKEFLRCAVLALLYVSVAVPTGTDYRMLHVCIALGVFILIKTKRPGDTFALILMAVELVPKKYYYLSLLSYPTTTNISIQVIINPLCVMGAMAVLIYSGLRSYDARWTHLRFQRFLRSLPVVGKLSTKLNLEPAHGSQ